MEYVHSKKEILFSRFLFWPYIGKELFFWLEQARFIGPRLAPESHVNLQRWLLTEKITILCWQARMHLVYSSLGYFLWAFHSSVPRKMKLNLQKKFITHNSKRKELQAINNPSLLSLYSEFAFWTFVFQSFLVPLPMVCMFSHSFWFRQFYLIAFWIFFRLIYS